MPTSASRWWVCSRASPRCNERHRLTVYDLGHAGPGMPGPSCLPEGRLPIRAQGDRREQSEFGNGAARPTQCARSAGESERSADRRGEGPPIEGPTDTRSALEWPWPPPAGRTAKLRLGGEDPGCEDGSVNCSRLASANVARSRASRTDEAFTSDGRSADRRCSNSTCPCGTAANSSTFTGAPHMVGCVKLGERSLQTINAFDLGAPAQAQVPRRRDAITRP